MQVHPKRMDFKLKLFAAPLYPCNPSVFFYLCSKPHHTVKRRPLGVPSSTLCPPYRFLHRRECTHFKGDLIMASTKIFTLEGRALKLDTAADIMPHIEALKANADVEEVRLNGNTLGIEACKALAEVLETKKNLKVRILYCISIFFCFEVSAVPDAATI